MIAWFATFFSYDFLVRALIVGSLVSVCAALLGVTLILKRYAMIGDGLSHVGFGALSIALVMNIAPLKLSIPIVVIAAVLLLRLSENSKIKGDGAIALISSSAIAIGVIATSLNGGANIDVNSYMFGSVLVMTEGDVILSVILSILVLIIFVFFYQEIFAVTFDETFARATGVRVSVYNMLIALLTAVTIVVGMRIMGTLLISGLIVFPALTAMRVFKRYRSVVVCAVAISVVCFMLGIMVSFALSLPAGASIVVVNLAALILFALVGIVAAKIRTS